MLSAQGDSRNSKSNKAGDVSERRLSWGMIVLGVVLIICALLLYLYYANNTQRISTPINTRNINRNPPGAGNSQTTPLSRTPTPTGSP